MLTFEKVESLLRPVLQGTDMELIELKVMHGKGRAGIVAVIDHRFRPIGLDELTALSRQFEDVLDMDEEVPREYSLDVTSPGVNRPLTFEWEFAKNVGRKLKVQLEAPVGETHGRLSTAVDESAPPPPPPTAKGRKKGESGSRHETFEAELTGVNEGTLTFDNGRMVPIEQVWKATVKLPW